jgi:CBS domain-containing membrane protein
MSQNPSTTRARAPEPGVRGLAVRDVMRRDFITISRRETLREALELMRLARLRHLTVESDGLLVGILSYRDLQDALLARGHPGAKALARPADGQEPAVDLVAGAPFSISPDASLAEAATRLERLRVGCLPVVERAERGLRLVGLLTETDLLHAAFAPS